jgi:hypothetical protein
MLLNLPTPGTERRRPLLAQNRGFIKMECTCRRSAVGSDVSVDKSKIRYEPFTTLTGALYAYDLKTSHSHRLSPCSRRWPHPWTPPRRAVPAALRAVHGARRDSQGGAWCERTWRAGPDAGSPSCWTRQIWSRPPDRNAAETGGHLRAARSPLSFSMRQPPQPPPPRDVFRP